ncbi:hypothetical protein SISNIDRAFT_416090, partial [Sistotremastrum niveocremeum HHB9708]
VQDGRYHQGCDHFVSMASRTQDCLRPNCLFSRRHVHPVGCNSASCIRSMDPPAKNAVRVSPSKCPTCLMRNGGHFRSLAENA